MYVCMCVCLFSFWLFEDNDISSDRLYESEGTFGRKCEPAAAFYSLPDACLHLPESKANDFKHLETLTQRDIVQGKCSSKVYLLSIVKSFFVVIF